MNLLWALVLPGTFVLVALIAARWAVRLQFFSAAARGLDQIDIPNEVTEIRINELEMLVGNEADSDFQHVLKLTRWERRQAVTRRLREARTCLHLIISNAALFQQIARFRIEQAASSKSDDASAQQDLAFHLMDRAATVHLIAATCLARLLLVDMCRLLWPMYVPRFANRFQFRGNDLIVWYRHLASEMLAFAQKHYDDFTCARFTFQLTGLPSLEEAARLKRL